MGKHGRQSGGSTTQMDYRTKHAIHLAIARELKKLSPHGDEARNTLGGAIATDQTGGPRGDFSSCSTDLSLRRSDAQATARSQGASPAFSIFDPAGTWAWRAGPVDAAALALLPAEPVVQLDAEAAVELPRRAEPAVQLDAEAAVLLHAKTVVAELPRHAEAAVLLHAEAALAELPRRAEAAVLLHAEAVVLAEAPVESPRRAEVSVAELPRWLEACSRGVSKRCRSADCQRRSSRRYRCRWLFRHAGAHPEAHDRPVKSLCCRCRFSYRRGRCRRGR